MGGRAWVAQPSPILRARISAVLQLRSHLTDRPIKVLWLRLSAVNGRNYLCSVSTCSRLLIRMRGGASLDVYDLPVGPSTAPESFSRTRKLAAKPLYTRAHTHTHTHTHTHPKTANPCVSRSKPAPAPWKLAQSVHGRGPLA